MGCMAKPSSFDRLARVNVSMPVPVLSYLEKMIYPRWPAPHEATKRVVGAMVVLLSTAVVLSPIPLSNVVPALVIALMSLAYLEEDGLLLTLAPLSAVIVLAVAAAAVWKTILGAEWISRLL
jgi:hypothetical protein